ncbi:hypothetical protein H0H92_007874 [Tricholoma furcatifolium]|nr:hypothetical protein H0H92_007874 [Tricholoma furcatifolium]
MTNGSRLITALVDSPSGNKISQSIHHLVRSQLRMDIQNLVNYDDKWQFGASSAKARQVEEFQLEQMGKTMASMSPNLWALIDTLLSATRKSTVDPLPMDDDDDEYWDQTHDMDLEGIIEAMVEDKTAKERRLATRRQAAITICLLIR